MAWPTVNFVKTHTDAGGDSPATARAELNLALTDLENVIEARGIANGVASLDAGALIPTGELPVVPVSKGGTGAADAATARTNLGAQEELGYAPVNQAGDAAMTGNYIIIDASQTPLIIRRNAAPGPVFQIISASPTPAALDILGGVEVYGNDDIGASQPSGKMRVKVLDISNVAYEAQIEFLVPNKQATNVPTINMILDMFGIKFNNWIGATNSLSNCRVGGVFYVDSVDRGNTAVTTEVDLASIDAGASRLLTDNDHLKVEAAGIFAANGNNKVVSLKLGTTVLVTSGTVTHNNKAWRIEGRVFRFSGSSSQRAVATLFIDGQASITTYSTPTEVMSGSPINLKTTGRSPTTGAANDVINKLFEIGYYPAP